MSTFRASKDRDKNKIGSKSRSMTRKAVRET
jgi:hypothetical protein